MTLVTFLSKYWQTSVAALSTACNDFNKGVLKSKDSPVYEIKIVGIHKVSPQIKAGDVGSQAV